MTPSEAVSEFDASVPMKLSKVKRKRRKTGKKGVKTPVLAERMQVFARSNFRCERCGKRLGEGEHVSVHHRTPRGMGGSHDERLNSFSNLMALCGSGTTGCHGWIEHNRAVAREQGWLVSRTDDPSKVPVLVFGEYVYLNSEGGYDRT